MTAHELLALIASGDPAGLRQAGEHIEKLRYADKTSLVQICRALKEAQGFSHNQLYTGPLHAKYIEITAMLRGLCTEAEATA